MFQQQHECAQNVMLCKWARCFCVSQLHSLILATREQGYPSHEPFSRSNFTPTSLLLFAWPIEAAGLRLLPLPPLLGLLLPLLPPLLWVSVLVNRALKTIAVLTLHRRTASQYS